MKHAQKIAKLLDDGAVRYSHPAEYRRHTHSSGSERIVAGVPDGDCGVLAALSAEMIAPFFLLYVLHTPRGEAKAGRYQSQEVSAATLHRFLKRFANYLCADARFDLWVYSPESEGTIVWDRHNLIYAYGPLRKYERVLRAMGFEEGNPNVEFAHAHYYRSECDEDAKALLDYFDWSCSPLQPEDEQ